MSRFEADDYRPLGDTGLIVSPVSLGTVKFGRNTDIKYPRDFDIPDENTLAKLLDTARELGINLLDTAPAYGTSEERLGHLLSGQRDDWLISTKVGEQYVAGESVYDYSAEATRQSLENSLRQLKTDYLDLVLVHSNGDDEEIINHTDCLSVLAQFRDKGIIRCIGVSTKTIAGGLAAVAHCDVVMVTLNFDDRSQLPVLQAASRANKGVMVKKALGSGHINEAGESLRFVLSQAAVSTAVVGTINPDHLRANVLNVTRYG